ASEATPGGAARRVPQSQGVNIPSAGGHTPAGVKAMPYSTMKTLAAAASVAGLLATALVQAQTAAPAAPARAYSAPRTPWGDPDLQGTYTNSDESGIPMSRPAQFAGRKP